MTKAKQTAAIIAAVALAFPREVVIVNETAAHYVVGNKHIGPQAREAVTVKDEADLARLETDCEALMSLVPVYGDLPAPPLRIVEAGEAGEPADPAATGETGATGEGAV